MATLNYIADRRLAIDELDKSIVNLSARINASTYELLVLIREFDERAGWLKWGLENCTQWLHWRCDLSRCAAREKVRVAHALKALPEISAAFSKGTLSYSKVRGLDPRGDGHERRVVAGLCALDHGGAGGGALPAAAQCRAGRAGGGEPGP